MPCKFRCRILGIQCIYTTLDLTFLNLLTCVFWVLFCSISPPSKVWKRCCTWTWESEENPWIIKYCQEIWWMTLRRHRDLEMMTQALQLFPKNRWTIAMFHWWMPMKADSTRVLLLKASKIRSCRHVKTITIDNCYLCTLLPIDSLFWRYCRLNFFANYWKWNTIYAKICRSTNDNF